MNDDIKTLLTQILGVINYEDDKDEFINKYINIINNQTFFNLIQSLPQDKQEEIENKLTQAKDDKEKTQEVFKEYFSVEQIEKSIKNSSKDIMTKYLGAISNTLSDVQSQNLIQLIEKYKPQTPTIS